MASLNFRIGMLVLSSFALERETWYKSEAAKDLLKRNGVLHIERLRCEKLPTKESRGWFMHFFTRSSNELAVTGGRRDTSMHGNFRESFLKAQNAKNPNFAEKRSHWCPIACTWLHKELITAAHIFPWKHGQEAMTRMFGTEAEHEMFSVQNGLVMSTMAKARMDKWLFVIVPLVNVESEAEVKAWDESSPKQYKLRESGKTRVNRWREKRDYIGKKKQPYDAELWAISDALVAAIKEIRNGNATAVTIFTDSSAAMIKMGKKVANPKGLAVRDLVYERAKELTKDGHSVTLRWIPGHSKIE